MGLQRQVPGIHHVQIENIMRTFIAPWNGERHASSRDHGPVATQPTLSTSPAGTDTSLSDHRAALPGVQGCDGHAGQVLAFSCTAGICRLPQMRTVGTRIPARAMQRMPS